jgi:hypothetical protein
MPDPVDILVGVLELRGVECARMIDIVGDIRA